MTVAPGSDPARLLEEQLASASQHEIELSKSALEFSDPAAGRRLRDRDQESAGEGHDTRNSPRTLAGALTCGNTFYEAS